MMVRTLAFLLVAVASCSMACEVELKQHVQSVAGEDRGGSLSSLVKCNSKVGSFNDKHTERYQKILNKALQMAFEYMSISSHFGRDTIHRLGFQKLFRDASDKRFQEAIDMAKYIVKRGGNLHNALKVNITAATHLKPDPLPSLGRALDESKEMYHEQARLHRHALCLDASQRGVRCLPDPDLAHETQEAIEGEVENINDMASKANVLTAMYTTGERSISEHLFDMHLLGKGLAM